MNPLVEEKTKSLIAKHVDAQIRSWGSNMYQSATNPLVEEEKIVSFRFRFALATSAISSNSGCPWARKTFEAISVPVLSFHFPCADICSMSLH